MEMLETGAAVDYKTILEGANWPKVAGDVLTAVVLAAIVGFLVPRAARIALRRGPVAARPES